MPAGTNGIFLVPIERGEKRKLISAPVSAGRLHWPAFSPGGDSFAYVSCTGDLLRADLNVLDLAGITSPKGQPRRLTRQGAVFDGIAWMPGGQPIAGLCSNIGY